LGRRQSNEMSLLIRLEGIEHHEESAARKR
jgi:hypothetical protein